MCAVALVSSALSSIVHVAKQGKPKIECAVHVCIPGFVGGRMDDLAWGPGTPHPFSLPVRSIPSQRASGASTGHPWPVLQAAFGALGVGARDVRSAVRVPVNTEQ